jgi:hypothetical protein
MVATQPDNKFNNVIKLGMYDFTIICI